jgi:hypothetical protein
MSIQRNLRRNCLLSDTATGDDGEGSRKSHRKVGKWTGCGRKSGLALQLGYLKVAARPLAQADAAIAAVVSGGLGRVDGSSREVLGKAIP